mmetsp:Transcript_98295/g.283653  ORF Transcript_98295/g.283653 Transcript_98295/m.283653 type:complete len:245 (-) Transcript_98295:282-1016(-)
MKTTWQSSCWNSQDGHGAFIAAMRCSVEILFARRNSSRPHVPTQAHCPWNVGFVLRFAKLDKPLPTLRSKRDILDALEARLTTDMESSTFDPGLRCLDIVFLVDICLPADGLFRKPLNMALPCGSSSSRSSLITWSTGSDWTFAAKSMPFKDIADSVRSLNTGCSSSKASSSESASCSSLEANVVLPTAAETSQLRNVAFSSSKWCRTRSSASASSWDACLSTTLCCNQVPLAITCTNGPKVGT